MFLNKLARKYIWLSTISKIRMNWHLFNILIVLLLLSAALTVSGGNSSRHLSEYGTSVVRYITGDMTFIFLLIWAFVVGWTLAKPAYRDMDFMMIANRLTSHVSSIVFMIVASVIGGMLAFFTLFLSKSAYLLINGFDSVIVQPYTITDIGIGSIVTLCLAFLLTTVGYLVGVLVNWNQAFVYLIPALIVSNVMMDARFDGSFGISQLVLFFASEQQWWMLFVKVLGFSVLVYGIVILLTRRAEVREA